MPEITEPRRRHALTLTLPGYVWHRVVDRALANAYEHSRTVTPEWLWEFIRNSILDCRDLIEQMVPNRRSEALVTITHPALHDIRYWINQYHLDRPDHGGDRWHWRDWIMDTKWPTQDRRGYVIAMQEINRAMDAIGYWGDPHRTHCNAVDPNDVPEFQWTD